MAATLRVFLIGSMLAALGAMVAAGQTIDFQLFVTDNNMTDQVTNGETVGVSSQVGTANEATVVAIYTGNSSAIVQKPTITQGSVEFTVSVPKNETFPLTLTPGQMFTFYVTYTPTSATQEEAVVQAPFTEAAASGGTPTTSAISLIFQGTVASFTLAYAIAPNNDFVQIANGGTIQFPPTTLNTPATATLDIENTGSAPGAITGITLPPTGSPFVLQGVPPASTTNPYYLNAAMALPIGIMYTPTAAEKDTAQITISFQGGTSDTITLAGSGITSTFTYSYTPGNSTTSTPVTPGQTITFPPVTLATTGTTLNSSDVIVQVKNTGAATGTINSVNVAPPFGLISSQTFPITLTTGGVASFTLSYTPTQVGTQTGELFIGSANFTVSGTSAAQLTFSPLTGGDVIFPSTAVSKSSTVNFTISNTGNSNAVITLVSTNSPFSVPVEPVTTLAPNGSMTFPITFTPTTVGTVNGTLFVNNTQIPLVGAGTTPPSLPSYTLSGPTGDVMPASQATISLTLAKSYSVDLDGVLTLTTSGSYGTDPAAEFSNGLRTVDFVIPAGSTSANFAGQGSQIFVQTGTVAETVTLIPTFETSAGVDVTPASPATLQFTIAPAAPVLETIAITGEASTTTTASFELVIVGYSTTRSLSSLNVTFTAASGFNLTISTPAVDLSGPGNVWFQSAASQAFGGLFQVTVPYNLTGSVSKNQTLFEAIGSVSATISNGVGTSNSLQAGP